MMPPLSISRTLEQAIGRRFTTSIIFLFHRKPTVAIVDDLNGRGHLVKLGLGDVVSLLLGTSAVCRRRVGGTQMDVPMALHVAAHAELLVAVLAFVRFFACKEQKKKKLNYKNKDQYCGVNANIVRANRCECADGPADRCSPGMSCRSTRTCSCVRPCECGDG